LSVWGAGLAFLVVLICFRVIAQMLGMPITLTSLFMADTSMESVCENSIPPVMLELGLISCSLLHEKPDPLLYHPIFETPAFHPPLG
jgi:hypothetical protein